MLKPDQGDAKFQGRPLGEWEPVAFRERVAWLNQVRVRKNFLQPGECMMVTRVYRCQSSLLFIALQGGR